MSKIGFVSLGCPKNLIDSEVMMGELHQAGHTIVSQPEQAETLVVNTCGFIDAAKKESIDAILEAVRMKEGGECRRVVVAGCLVERYQQELRRELPEVDAFIGTNQVSEIARACDASVNPRSLPVITLGNQSATYLYDESTPRIISTPSHTAYVKIAEGCDRPCAFCFIPQMRGHFRSRRFGSVVAEAQQLAQRGVQEVILVAQDSSRYGEDLGIKDGLALLLQELAHIEKLQWVRVMYAYPTHISDQFLRVMTSEPKAVKYLDIPLQHASAKVLKLMRRGGTRESLARLIKRVRSRVPGVSIRTTFITGFPGETEDDFQELLSFVREMEFERIGAFVYSDEQGTPAYGLPGKVSRQVAEQRRSRLMKEQARISLKHNRSRIGSTMRVLFEGESHETDLLWQGRMQNQAPDIDGCVLINDAPAGLVPSPGDFVNVLITEAHEYDLVGRICEPGRCSV